MKNKIYVLGHEIDSLKLIREAVSSELSFFDFKESVINSFFNNSYFVSKLTDYKSFNETVTFLVTDKSEKELRENISLQLVTVNFNRSEKKPITVSCDYAFFEPVVKIKYIEDKFYYMPLLAGVLNNFAFNYKVISPLFIENLSVTLSVREKHTNLVDDYVFILNNVPIKKSRDYEL